MQLQTTKLPHRNGQHPEIEGNVDGGVGPGHSIDIDAVTLRGNRPLGPISINGRTLENAGKNKGNTVGDDDGKGPPQQSSSRGPRENAHIEGEESKFNERCGGEVKGRGDVKVHQGLGDLLG